MRSVRGAEVGSGPWLSVTEWSVWRAWRSAGVSGCRLGNGCANWSGAFRYRPLMRRNVSERERGISLTKHRGSLSLPAIRQVAASREAPRCDIFAPMRRKRTAHCAEALTNAAGICASPFGTGTAMRCIMRHFTNGLDGDWIRVSRTAPCPVCGGAADCRTHSEEAFACCVQQPSEWRLNNGGWLHRVVASSVRSGGSVSMSVRPEVGVVSGNVVSDSVVASATSVSAGGAWAAGWRDAGRGSSGVLS